MLFCRYHTIGDSQCSITLRALLSIVSIGSVMSSNNFDGNLIDDSQTNNQFNLSLWKSSQLSILNISAQRESLVEPIGEGESERDLDGLRERYNLYTSERMELMHQIYSGHKEFKEELTIAEFNLATLTTRSLSLIYDDMMMQRYESYAELKQSFGPQTNQELCLKQLEQLNERTDLVQKEKFNSTDLELYQLLDSYGRQPPGISSMGIIWHGIYEQCLTAKIELLSGQMPTRYCFALIKHNAWPQDDQLNKILAFKVGVCLPKACDSQKYKNKFELIEKLMDFNVREIDKNQSTLDSLYCLPDEDSPMRMWWKWPKTVLTVSMFVIWISILIFATLKYELHLNQSQLRNENDNSKQLNEQLAGKSSFKSSLEPRLEYRRVEEATGRSDKIFNLKIYQMLAITNNFKSLFNTTTTTTTTTEMQDKSKSKGMNEKENESDLKQNFMVDLNSIEGIKVLCMGYIIMAHVLMCISTIISNGRELATTLSPIYILTNVMSGIAVDSFFTITGILTCYLSFKRNKSSTFITSPIKWATFITYRYLRIMPMYIVVMCYSKYISKFIGSGPMWDYGTSSLGQRRLCEQESWITTLLFGSNYKPVLDQCIASSWYLASDFQFFIITPIFLVALHKSTIFGQNLLKISIIILYFVGILDAASTNAPDLRPIAKFMPHGFMTYVIFFSTSYTYPQFRIPAYLCGLLLGFKLYIYEQNKINFQESAKSKEQVNLLRRLDWPDWFVDRAPILSFISLLLIPILPIIGYFTPYNKFYAKLISTVFPSSYHILFSLSIGSYILLSATGHGNKFLNRFLSASIWKPLARLSLCAVLINIEVINYIVQSQTQPIHLNFFTQSAFSVLSVLITYLVALVMFVLFEAPLKGVLNELLKQVIATMNDKATSSSSEFNEVNSTKSKNI